MKGSTSRHSEYTEYWYGMILYTIQFCKTVSLLRPHSGKCRGHYANTRLGHIIKPISYDTVEATTEKEIVNLVLLGIKSINLDDTRMK